MSGKRVQGFVIGLSQERLRLLDIAEANLQLSPVCLLQWIFLLF